ncbi:MAG: hypothetical protein CL840_07930 [Crocinitomicaceae bacterium]|nr:hypothetical protein [Crocinitomicaceae bacterium]|tara:strand:- start:1198 stop:1686 length:489 start_codon:yes stop_codon:yes gene_type:complete
MILASQKVLLLFILWQKIVGMKRIAVLIVLICLGFSYSSQGQSCLENYRKAFMARGSEDVVDSTYEDVIISIRAGETNECYLGMVTVRNGKILLDNFYIKLEDNTYDNIGPRLKSGQPPVEINNGVSQLILDKRDSKYNVVFVSHIKPKKKGFMKAPDFDLN